MKDVPPDCSTLKASTKHGEAEAEARRHHSERVVKRKTLEGVATIKKWWLHTPEHWKILMFNRKYIFKWWMFYCHDSFLGGKLLDDDKPLLKKMMKLVNQAMKNGGPSDFQDKVPQHGRSQIDPTTSMVSAQFFGEGDDQQFGSPVKVHIYMVYIYMVYLVVIP